MTVRKPKQIVRETVIRIGNWELRWHRHLKHRSPDRTQIAKDDNIGKITVEFL